jgi:hypothetical protein
MVYLTLDIIAVSSSLIITRDKNTFSNYLIKIEVLSVAFLIFRFISARTVDRFSAVYSTSARFRIWRNIYYSNF